MKKTVWFLLSLIPGLSHAVIISWYTGTNPQGQTIDGVTLGEVTGIAVYCADVTTLTSANIGNATRVASANASYGMDSWGSDNIITAEGNNFFSSDGFTSGSTYFIVAQDTAGNFFASNPLTAYSSAGWSEVPTEIFLPDSPEWTPEGFGSSTEALNRWQTSGVIPEPSSAGLLLLGSLVLFFYRPVRGVKRHIHKTLLRDCNDIGLRGRTDRCF